MGSKPHYFVGMFFVGLCSVLIVVACGGANQNPGNPGSPQQLNFFQIVNGMDHPSTIQYAYAPSIILQDNTYHVFFCSGGNISPAWDYIRYVNSTDNGKSWSAPVDMLHATAFNGMDLAACDPNVVFFQGYYYMYYGSAITTAPDVYQNVVQVARAVDIAGPYLTYTERGTWEDTPTDPQIIVKPLLTRTSQPSGYGAGQPSVVVANGKLLMWYTDDSLFVSQKDDFDAFHLYMLESSDPVSWIPDRNKLANIAGQDSPDIKFDPVHNRFVATWVLNMFTTEASVERAFSSDGRTWTPSETLISNSAFPAFANNIGTSADHEGHLLPTKMIVGFGHPYSQHDVDAGLWNMDGVLLDPP